LRRTDDEARITGRRTTAVNAGSATVDSPFG
jgi:hypothetical protein